MSGLTIEELERRLDGLQKVKVFDERVRGGVERLLASTPNFEEERDPETKVRLLFLRCKALTLLPSYSREAEQACGAALKLRHDRPDLWVLLSECLARRNATREACDALDNALHIDAHNVEALCQYSRLLRTLSSDSKLTQTERLQHLNDSVARGKAAAAACPTSTDAWNCYSIALLSKALSSGVDIAGAKQALQAMRQAARLSPEDPDVRFNKGGIEGLLGHFGNAACDFLAAYEADKTRLKGTKQMLENHLTVLRRAESRIHTARQAGKRNFASLLAKLPSSPDAVAVKSVLEGSATAPCRVTVGAVDVLSEPTMEPTVLLAAEKSGEFLLLLLYGLRQGSVKGNNTTISLSFPDSTPVRVTHEVPDISFLETSAHTATYTQVFVDLKTTLINGQPVPSRMLVSPTLFSTMFV
ncbi:tetratricopeptide repeat domain 5 [Trypanosoma conorhini]|uniref:Tetratricopeptide repeat domain 5 n=1 Tax=Trypanosoma conorhini TaxID=83891 RepID=A0A422NNA9_9TRYP|nr:tetratricopeptide repeat domain 5 [Trypanosoma conorhini]RNF06978.1 tetratricopeptide repeat domain 5 [Trypanosoma conorhini]